MTKTATPKTPASASTKTTVPAPEMADSAPITRVLKSASCPTLSGNSTLTYQLGCLAGLESAIRLYAYTGRGFFNQDWIGLDVIRTLLDEWPVDKPITSYALSSLYRGRSANNRAFLFAALMAEGLIQQTSGTPPSYAIGDTVRFLAEVGALMASEVSLPEASPVTPDRKTTVTKKAPKKAGSVAAK